VLLIIIRSLLLALIVNNLVII